MSDLIERLEATKFGLFWDLARDAIAEITRLRTALSEAEQRVQEARRIALEEAAKVADAMPNLLPTSPARLKVTSPKDVAARIRALIPSEPQPEKYKSPDIFNDAEGRN